MNQLKNIEPGIEMAGWKQITAENIMVFGLLFFGAWLVSFFKVEAFPVLTVSYLGFAVVMLGFILRKHLCTNCWYYGRQCHCGWGKLAAILFEENSGNYRLGGVLGNVTWMVVMLFPLAAFGVGVIINATSFVKEWPIFLAFLTFLGINGVIHKKSCTRCKMRCVCPGSATKTGC